MRPRLRSSRFFCQPDAANSIIGVARNPKWSDFSDKVFVMLGAGAAMGPFLTLMAMGANVVAIDVPVPGVWEVMGLSDSCIFLNVSLFSAC